MSAINAVYESLKEYYNEHGEIMPPTQFIKFHGRYTEQELLDAVMEFDAYLNNLQNGGELIG